MKRLSRVLLVLIISVLVFSSCTGNKAPSAEVQEKEYTAVGKLFCESSSSAEETNLNALMVKKELAATTYAEILSSNAFLEKVSEDIGGVFTQEKLRDMVSFINEDDEILIVSVTAGDSEDALAVCKSIFEVAPDYISGIIGHGTVRTIEKPYIVN